MFARGAVTRFASEDKDDPMGCHCEPGSALSSNPWVSARDVQEGGTAVMLGTGSRWVVAASAFVRQVQKGNQSFVAGEKPLMQGKRCRD